MDQVSVETCLALAGGEADEELLEGSAVSCHPESKSHRERKKPSPTEQGHFAFRSGHGPIFPSTEPPVLPRADIREPAGGHCMPARPGNIPGAPRPYLGAPIRLSLSTGEPLEEGRPRGKARGLLVSPQQPQPRTAPISCRPPSPLTDTPLLQGSGPNLSCAPPPPGATGWRGHRAKASLELMRAQLCRCQGKIRGRTESPAAPFTALGPRLPAPPCRGRPQGRMSGRRKGRLIFPKCGAGQVAQLRPAWAGLSPGLPKAFVQPPPPPAPCPLWS